MIAVAALTPPIEKLQAHFVQHREHNFLLSGDGAEAFASLGADCCGPVIFVRYGVALAAGRGIFIPARAVHDYGRVYDGMAALDWMVKSGLQHPRADAIGLCDDGSAVTFLLRELDLAIAPTVFASGDANDFPGSRVAASVHLEGEGCGHSSAVLRADNYLPVVRIPALTDLALALEQIARKIAAAS
ncbi:MAG TPA: hypothetical protein QF589_08430 [Anaerolineales bacterium]|mgnify:FL=1|nr:hypothetical protein [Anaerolineaceae bacterium]MDP7545520.1 hypothetical protein [Anaerolineales bacterium]HJN42122.1 hypothetical protein [Anaerolineales bacterium]